MRYCRFSVIVTFIAFFITSRSDALDLGNIMPLGDSITAGYTPSGGIPGGYRQELYNNLTTAGYSFKFVGSQTTYLSDTLKAVGQQCHEGHNAYTIQQIINGVKTSNWLGVNPDIVLLHIGANDVLNADAATAPDRLDALIGDIFAQKPNVKIIVAKIIGGSTVTNASNATAYDAGIVAYNAAIEQKVAARAQAGEHVSLVDMYSLLNINHQADMQGNILFADISHPNQTGYNVMGDTWAGAIKAVATPEPGTISLLISGLFGILVYVWRKRR
jgi:lysophospholipase L1-like esterase